MHYVLDTQNRHKAHTVAEHKCHIGHHWHHHKSHNNVQYNYHSVPMWVCVPHHRSMCVCVHRPFNVIETKWVCLSVCVYAHIGMCVLTMRVHMSVCESVTHIVTSKHHCLVAMADGFSKAGLQIAPCISFPSLSLFFFLKLFVYFPQPLRRITPVIGAFILLVLC